MIDLHCHVLPGIDDGPASLDGSLALARAAAAAGIETLVATPHVSARYHNDAATIAPLVAQVNAALVDDGVAVRVLAGAEVAMTRVAELRAGELSLLGLGGGSWLLLEPPFGSVATGLDSIVAELQQQGHHVLLAHPERCQAFHRDPALVSRLVSSGVRTSVTADSLAGRFGSTVRRFALAMFDQELVHNVTSDAHDHVNRPPGIAAQLERAGYGAMSEWLAVEVPRAILTDEALPARPSDGSRRARGRWRLRR
ncbi:MAG TPA: CpsB/CapC family capsule biosynthesis tyrosine phosphatase [Solirubrobacteraceae bacterium]|nr:CpsB/CapC family capsule biosynthesis tyrosine phosphatase [Solirubrobacteraceae bacterium]